MPFDDAARDVLREHLDEQRFLADDEVDRLLEELREAGHVHALLVGREIDGAVDDGGHDGLCVAAPDAHRLLDPAHAGVGEGKADLGRRGLEVLDEMRGVGHRQENRASGRLGSPRMRSPMPSRALAQALLQVGPAPGARDEGRRERDADEHDREREERRAEPDPLDERADDEEPDRTGGVRERGQDADRSAEQVRWCALLQDEIRDRVDGPTPAGRRPEQDEQPERR